MIQKRLQQSPLYRKKDLGIPLPPTKHGCSVCLPTWQDVIGYEEADPAVIEKLQLGYPRFVFHPLVQKAFDSFNTHGELCSHIYATKHSAEECVDYILSKYPEANAFSEEIKGYSAASVFFPEECAATAKEYWQHTGEGISSRYAEALLNKTVLPDASKQQNAVIEQIAKLNGVSSDNVFLYSSGMSAISAVQRACRTLFPNLESIQFSFPYSDSLKLQEKFNPGALFFPHGGDDDLKELEKTLANRSVSSLQCEFPTNPLLTCVDLEQLSKLAREHSFPLIVDDTISSYANVNLIDTADVVVTSLTKFFSGSGEVMGGAIVINPNSSFNKKLINELSATYEPDNYCSLDIIEIEKASTDFSERMKKINATTETLCDYLNGHPKVETVYYPKYTGKELYDTFKKDEGGYGGVFSILLKNAENVSEKFFDELEISKGPNLGTSFSLACPFTILAHYHELEFAENAGASRWLIRFSIGLENTADLIKRFDKVLDTI